MMTHSGTGSVLLDLLSSAQARRAAGLYLSEQLAWRAEGITASVVEDGDYSHVAAHFTDLALLGLERMECNVLFQFYNGQPSITLETRDRDQASLARFRFDLGESFDPASGESEETLRLLLALAPSFEAQVAADDAARLAFRQQRWRSFEAELQEALPVWLSHWLRRRLEGVVVEARLADQKERPKAPTHVDRESLAAAQ